MDLHISITCVVGGSVAKAEVASGSPLGVLEGREAFEETCDDDGIGKYEEVLAF